MKQIDDLRTDYEGKPMEIASDLVFRSRIRDIQAVVSRQTASWKIFICVLFHPLDLTLVIRKYAGGSVQGNILGIVRIELGNPRLGGSRAVPNTYGIPRSSLILFRDFVDKQESAVGPETVLIDSGDDGEFTEPLHMTRTEFQSMIGRGRVHLAFRG